MHKTVHRTVSIVIAFLIFFIVGKYMSSLGAHLFIMFLVMTTAIILSQFLFQKVPMKCDQKNCGGVASFYCAPEFHNSFLKYVRFEGHKCRSCGHVITPPRNGNN